MTTATTTTKERFGSVDVLEFSPADRAHVAISAWIGSGRPDAEAGAIAAAYTKLYESRSEPELHYIALDE